MAGAIRVTREQRVATVVLDHPPLNPIGLAMVDELARVIDELGADREVRAVIIAGKGQRAFSVGANIAEFGAGVAQHGLDGFLGQRHALIHAIEAMPKPVIAAIAGLCLGGGLELALGCHFRLASADARLGLPEIDLGVIPAWGGTQRLVRLIGRAHALDMMLRGRKLPAAEAHRIGLIGEVCEPDALMPRATELARELAEKPPLAVAAILECTVRGSELSLADGLALELKAIGRVATSRDAGEGISAFLAKRKPEFRGE